MYTEITINGPCFEDTPKEEVRRSEEEASDLASPSTYKDDSQLVEHAPCLDLACSSACSSDGGSPTPSQVEVKEPCATIQIDTEIEEPKQNPTSQTHTLNCAPWAKPSLQ